MPRSIYHLFLLEYNMSDAKDQIVSESAQQRNRDNANETQSKVKKSKRRTAVEARDKI